MYLRLEMMPTITSSGFITMAFLLPIIVLSSISWISAQNITTTLTPETTSWSPTVRPNDTEPAIIRGQYAQPNEIPWQARLLSGYSGRNTISGCGGSLVRPTWVLTAAHCFDDSDHTIVEMGHTNIHNMPYRVEASQRIPHERYNPSTLENDVALLRLPFAPQLGPNIQLVPMATSQWGDIAGQYVRVSGFGYTRNGTDTSPDLLKLDFVTLKNQECAGFFNDRPVFPSTLCAWYTERGSGKATCGGDSGGPLTMWWENQHFLVGVVSFGPTTCDNGAPAGFARVSSYYDWIQYNMNMNS